MKAEIKSSKEEIKMLKGELQCRNGSGSGTNTDANKKNRKKTDNNDNKEGGDKHSKLTCQKCKEKGHIAKNCPKKGEGEDKESEGDGYNKNKWTSPYGIPPKDGEPQVKKLNDVECAWCDQCKRWTKGEKKHGTAQHKTRQEIQAAQANLARGNSDDEFDDGLRMTQGFH